MPFNKQVLLLLLTLVLTLASCQGEGEDYVNTSRDVTVSFTMSLGSPQQVTRANTDWTDYDSIAGHDVENYIDYSRLQVFLYDSVGHYLSRVEHLVVSRDNDDSTKYNVEGVMRVDTLALASGYRFSGKLVVYANTDASSLVGDSLNSSDVSGMSFAYTPGSQLNSIPMYGVKALQDADFTPGRRTDLGDVWLLRSMAKVEVSLTDEMAGLGYTLTKVTFDRYNTRGYVLPQGYNAVDNTRLLNYDDGFALSFNPLGSEATAPIDFTGKTLYMPEYENSMDNPTTITVTIQHPDGSVRTATFDFASYADGNRSGDMNIVRNHYYQFHVYGNPLKIDLTVQPWTVFTHGEIIM